MKRMADTCGDLGTLRRQRMGIADETDEKDEIVSLSAGKERA